MFCKDSANREQCKINIFIFMAEMPPILFKDKTYCSICLTYSIQKNKKRHLKDPFFIFD